MVCELDRKRSCTLTICFRLSSSPTAFTAVFLACDDLVCASPGTERICLRQNRSRQFKLPDPYPQNRLLLARLQAPSPVLAPLADQQQHRLQLTPRQLPLSKHNPVDDSGLMPRMSTCHFPKPRQCIIIITVIAIPYHHRKLYRPTPP